MLEALMDLQGKVALVTGAAAGLGLEYVKIMLNNGIKHAAILDSNHAAGSAAVGKLNEKFGADTAIFIACDVTKKEDLEGAFRKTLRTFKKLHIVINNAGIMRDSVWELEISLNFTALVRTTFLALDLMGKDKGGEGGVVVNIASVAGLIPVPVLPVYAATKRAVIGFSQSLGVPFHEDRTGVRVLTLCPGATDTPMISDSRHCLLDDAWSDHLSAVISSVSIQKPEFVASALLHMLKNAENGSVWVVRESKPVYEIKFPDYETCKVYQSQGGVCHRFYGRIIGYIMDPQGKVALVTGGATGIGLEYVKILLGNGVKHVAILDVNLTAGSAEVKKINETFGAGCAIFIACDATKKDDIEDAFKKTVSTFKILHIVINNAGIMRDSVWELEISLNFTALVRSTFLALDLVGKDKGGEGGVVVNIASVAGIAPVKILPVYAGTKRAVIGFSQSIGAPFHEDRTGVRVLTLCPGVTDTPLISESPRYLLDKAWADELSTSLRKIPTQKPEFVATALLEILKNAKSGSVWIAEGGKPVYEIKFPHYKTLKI
ncbi:uncharacterized protein LOC134537073 [Bacillus rossius redtenbacheri]|uniref:uncharacterized protein LOC134537073 n=1 Tax=Bacillus rossius redtenbacheri TaxID=93214 RepID=UPI002FDEFC24